MATEKAAPKAKVPEGYDTVEEFLAEARDRHQQGVNADRDNREQGVEDLKFLAGEQWDAAALEQRAGRPCLTINQMPSFIAQVVGDIRQNRPAIRVRPVEDADKDLAEIREGQIRFIERDNDAQGVYVQTAESQVACGIGNFGLGLKYAEGNSFDRDITIRSIPNPFAVVWDPGSTERTGRDADWCFVDDTMPRKAFERTYKDKLESALTVPTADTQGWYTSDNVRITEYWRMCSRPIKLALLEAGEVVKLDEVPAGVQPQQVRDAEERYACLHIITGKDILAGPYELPIDRVPIIRAQGWVVNVGDRRVRFGLIRWAKDAQRLKNYWRSVSAEMLALAPKAKWLLHESNEGDQEQFRNAHANDDTILTWAGSTVPQLISPPQINAAVLQESAANAQDMKDVTGIHDASLGIKSNETSGKAIMARQREGDVSSYIYPDNLAASVKEAGRVINQLIPVVFDTPRTIRVLGEDETLKVQKINDPNDPESIDINRGRYDIAVDTGPSYTTKRVEAADSMMQFVQSVPMAGQVAGDLIAQSMDWPMADKLAERLKKAIPPQLQDQPDENTPPTPQQQQQAQAQAQQAEMQQQAAALELAKKQADVLKAQAEAAEAEADAMRAQYETGHLIGAGHLPGQGPPDLEESATGEALTAA